MFRSFKAEKILSPLGGTMYKLLIYMPLLALTLVLGASTARAADLQPYPVKGQVVQRLNVFDNPEGAIFSADGQFVFVSNAADVGMPDKDLHWTHKGGSISKLAVQPDGSLKMINEKLITGLTGPLGMAVNPVATKKFPAGTIFVIEAWAPLAEADGTEVKDPSVLDPKIIGFNSDGTVLGAIKLGAGSSAAKAAGVIATLGNALAFDKDGNLYAIDTGVAGGLFDPPIETKGGGAYMFPVSSLDALADGQSAPVSYIATPEGGPDGIEVAPDGTIHFNTVGPVAGLKDPADGGMYRVTKEDFKNGKLPAPFAQGLGGLDGLDFVGNVRLDTEIKNTNSVVVTPTAGVPMMLTYDKDIKLVGPADIAVRKMSDGSYLLVIPELSATSPNKSDNPVTIVRLPANFDRP
jgi:DNA-binding beta-propeller fold protein YncE